MAVLSNQRLHCHPPRRAFAAAAHPFDPGVEVLCVPPVRLLRGIAVAGDLFLLPLHGDSLQKSSDLHLALSLGPVKRRVSSLYTEVCIAQGAWLCGSERGA